MAESRTAAGMFLSLNSPAAAELIAHGAELVAEINRRIDAVHQG